MRNIYVDFDGVLNSYKTAFEGTQNLPDPPIPGALEWLEELTKHYHVTIFSTRLIEGPAQAAIMNWFRRHGLPFEVCDKLAFSCIKGGADLYIDDRAYRFEGVYPSMEEIKAMKPWYK